MEQTINISEIKKLLPSRATVTFQKKKGQTGTYLEIDVKLNPHISEKEHNALVTSIIDFLGEDLLEVYTKTTGYHFLIYVQMSSTQPTTVVI